MLLSRSTAALLLALTVSACSNVRTLPAPFEDDGDDASGSVASSSAATSTITVGTGGGEGGDGGEGGGGGPPGLVPGIVGVGYGNLRIVSRDDGLTWTDRVVEGDPNDAHNILWSVTWGAGRWFAVGERMLTSLDGVVWTDDTASMPCDLAEGIAFFQNELWIGCNTVTDGPVVFRSVDGVTWGGKTQLDLTGQHVFVFAHDATLVAHGDASSVLLTQDGENWETMQGIDWPAFCNGRWNDAIVCGPDSAGSSWSDGTWLRAQWPGIIQRSLDGESYADVYVDPEGHTVFDSRSFAWGWVAAE